MLNLVYRPPNGDHKELENYFKTSLSKWEISQKDLLDLDANRKVQNFVNLRFCFGMIPTINKATPVTKLPARLVLSSQTL